MRPIWKGSICFGLVSFPFAIVPASKRDYVSFRILRAMDLSPINYKRVSEADGREVEWKDIVKGYEYEKGKFVVLKDEDFRRADVEATETIDIIDFVPLAEVSPMLFTKPYYLEPLKGAAKAYTLLRDALRGGEKVGITKLVIKTRQHLAALKPHGDLLVIDLMHFPDELIDPQRIAAPASTAKPAKKELNMAGALIDEMTDHWDPARYTDDYRSALVKLIERKVTSGGRELPAARRQQASSSNVIDLVSVLKESLAETSRGKRRTRRPRAKSTSRQKRPRKAAA
jgi:DNA end-binding protein Ku